MAVHSENKGVLYPVLSILESFRILTRLPLPPAPTPSEEGLAAAVTWFPLTGGVVGLLSGIVYYLVAPPLGPLAGAVLAALTGVLLTGGMHLDGLADTVDGLARGGTREDRLAAMRDPRTGALGSTAIAGDLIVRTALLATLSPLLGILAAVLAAGFGRWAMVLAMPRFPYARSQAGLGRSFAGRVGHGHVAAATVVASIPALFAVFGPFTHTQTSIPFQVALAPATGAFFISFLAAPFIARRLGGLTGDTYGAINEVAEITALALFVAWV